MPDAYLSINVNINSLIFVLLSFNTLNTPVYSPISIKYSCSSLMFSIFLRLPRLHGIYSSRENVQAIKGISALNMRATSRHKHVCYAHSTLDVGTR